LLLEKDTPENKTLDAFYIECSFLIRYPLTWES
jgi:hypothetical protein